VEEVVNETFSTSGLSGMTHADTVGIAIVIIATFLAGVFMIAYGIHLHRSKRDESYDENTFADFRSTDRDYDPTSDAGFGVRRDDTIVQDPAGYWRTAQPYEAPIGYARVTPQVPQPRHQLQPRAIAARPVSPASGYRTDPRSTSLLGLGDELPTPVSPPMYPVPPRIQPAPVPVYAPMPREEFDSIVPTSPPVPSARHYRPAVAQDHYEPITYAPIDPTTNFNPLGQQYKPQAQVSVGRHARISAPGTESQRHWMTATGQLDVIELQQLLAVG
jgi:hypothetical protein